MTTGPTTAAALSLASAVSWGAGDFSGGLAAKRSSVFKVVAIAHGIGFLAMLVMALVTRESIPPAIDLAWGAVAGITGAFGIAALYKALAIGRMGVVAPVAAVVTGALPVLVGMRTEGLPHAWQLAGFAIALCSIWLLAKPSGAIDTHRGLGLALLSGICFGLFLISGKQAGHHAVFWPMVSARLASTLLMSVVVIVTRSASASLRGALSVTILSGLLDSFGNALFIAATQHGRLDVSAVLSSLYPASTVILARVLLKERLAPLQMVGMLGALVAVALIAMP